jgi:hypothetical protein
MTPREKTSQLLRELGVRGGLLIDPKFRLNLVMVAGKDGERCNVRCPHLQAGPKQSYCTLFGQYIEKLILLGHVRHESCSNDPDVKACESYSLGRLQVVETFNAALSEQIKREAAEQWIKYSRAEEKRHNGR